MRTFPARLFERLADTQPTRAGLRRVLGEVEVEPVFVLAIMGIGGRRPKLNVSTLAGQPPARLLPTGRSFACPARLPSAVSLLGSTPGEWGRGLP
jgi:hypothetical protein